MTEFYEANNRNPQSCDFAGNATVNKNAPSSITNANAAVSSCLTNPSAIFTPSAPSTASGSSQTGSGSGSGSGSKNNGAVAGIFGSQQAMVGLVIATFVSVAGGVLTVL